MLDQLSNKLETLSRKEGEICEKLCSRLWFFSNTATAQQDPQLGQVLPWLDP